MAPPPYNLHSQPLPIKKRMMVKPSSPKPEVRRRRRPRAPPEPGRDPRKRTSIYRGVTKHRYTGRFEAHLWDSTSATPNKNKKGRQIYLGAYDDEAAAARTYDLACLKYWGPNIPLNFPEADYAKEYEEMQLMGREEYLASLRRYSSGFSRGVSKYRGVAKHHNNGKWEARIGRVIGNKYWYLGIYETEEQAAAAYDLAAIKCRGPKAVTNFDISRYNVQQPEQLPDQHPLLPECLPPQLEQVPQFVPDTMEDVPWTMYADSSNDITCRTDDLDVYDSISFDDVDIDSIWFDDTDLDCISFDDVYVDGLFEGFGFSGGNDRAEENAAAPPPPPPPPPPSPSAAADAAADDVAVV